MNNFVILLYVFLMKFQLSEQQTQNCQPDQTNCCDISCSSCSDDKISKCTSCKFGYVYFSESYQCQEKCPEYSYLDNITRQCKQCASKYCLSCTENICMVCKPGYIIDPQDQKSCISICSQNGKFLDESGQCNVNCIDEKYYNLDNKSKTCVPNKSCPTIKKTPQLSNKAKIQSSLLNYSKNRDGYVVIYSYPDLKELFAFQIELSSQIVFYFNFFKQILFSNQFSSQVINCSFIDDNYHQQGKVTCLLSHISLITFLYQDGTVIQRNTLNTRQYTIEFDSARNWHLCMAGSSQLVYELQFIDYQNNKGIVLDAYVGVKFIAKTIKPFSSQSKYYEVLNFCIETKQIIYYKTFPFSKIIVGDFLISLNRFEVVQLYSYKYWVYYSYEKLALLKFNKEALSMVVVHQIAFQGIIKQITLQPRADSILIVYGSTSFQLSLVMLDEIQNQLVMLPQNLNDLLPNTFYMYSLEDIIIACELSSITAYQIQWENITLKSLGKLKETSGNLCSTSSFYLTKFDQTIHIQQTIFGNINLNIFDTVNKTNKSSIIPYFDDTQEVLEHQTVFCQIFQIIIENTQKQLLLEFKNYGLIYMYDPIKKNIVNQVRFWSISREYKDAIFFSYVKMTDITYLFCGFEYKMFKIKMMNIKTLQITYEQEFPEIYIPFPEIIKFKYPVYYNNTDSIVVYIEKTLLLADVQSRFDFLFFKNKKGTVSNDPNRYELVKKELGLYAKSCYFSTQAERLIYFFVVEPKYYYFFIYDNNGNRVLQFTTSIYSKSLTLAQVNEEKKIAQIFGYNVLITVNLTSLTYTTLNYTTISSKTCASSTVLNPDFTRLYQQNGCGDNTLYFYPLFTGLYTNPVINTYIFTYKWSGNYLTFNTGTNLLQIFDSSKVKMFQQTSILGTNIYSTVWDTSAVFFNSVATVHYDLTTQQIQLADVYTMQQYYDIEIFKSIVIDEELGYFFSTNLDKDCVFNMKTYESKCYKEIETYQGPSGFDIPDYMQQLFLNKKTKVVIICQMISVRLFSLIDLKYVGSIYDTNFNAGQFFYNEHLNYIIYTQRENKLFYTLDLITLKTNSLYLEPPPSKGYQTISYRLNSTDLTDVQKNMIWDQYKQKLIVSSNTILYVIGIDKQLIEFYFYDIDKIVQIQLIPNANLFQVSSYQSSSLFDYDYLISTNKETFPNQIHPRYYKVNDDVIFHISDYRCQANLFVNNKITGSWIRNNLFLCYIRFAENDLSKQQIYTLFDKEIVILDVSSKEIVQEDQYFLTDNIVEILYEDNNNVFLYSQSQQILSLQKKQQKIKINIVMSVSQGIGQYFFSKDSKQFIFTDQISNTTINIAQFNNQQNVLTGQIITPLILSVALKDFKLLNDTILVGLHANYLRLYDLQSLSQIKSVTFPIKHNLTNIQIDYENNRIFVQNRLSGSLVYDFNLVQSPQKRINTFSNDLSFDKYFIYSVTSHSANIYFRKDLKFLINFRHFNSSLALKKISYLGVGYIFMVEFITKLSIYEFSPITGKPLEKDIVNLNQFSIIKSSLLKSKIDKIDKMYLFSMYGFTLEGMFEYSFELDIFSEFSDSCSFYFPLFDSVYQEKITLNHLTQLLKDKKIFLEKLQISILPSQTLHFSNISEEIISSNFGMTLSGQNGNEYLYTSNSQISQSSIKYLYMKKMELKIEPQIYLEFIQLNKIPNSLEINKILFPYLTQFFIEDVILKEVQLVITDIQSIVIKNLTITNNIQQNKNFLRSLTKIKISKSQLIQIDLINIQNNYFDISQPLFEITDSRKVIINNLYIKDNSFQCLKELISFSRIEYLEIKQIHILQNKMNELTLLFGKQITSLKITDIMIKNLQYGLNKYNTQRIMEESVKKIQRIIDFEDMQSIEIDNLQMDSFFLDSNNLLQILSINNVQSELNLNNLGIQNFQIQKNQQGIIFSLKGINVANLNYIRIQSISYLQCLTLDSYQVSRFISYTSYRFNVNDIQISNYNISQSNVIYIYSQQIQIQTFMFRSIQFDEISDLIIPAIRLKAINNLDILDANLADIIQFNDSVIQIYESANINIQNSKFININSNGSGTVIKVVQSTGVVLLNNIFQNNESINGNGGVINYQQSTILNMQFNQFNENQATNGSGGAIYCDQSIIQNMSSNQFNLNKAINGSGGAILLQNCDIEKFMNNTFISNSAFIGGSIRYLLKKPLFMINNDLSTIKKQNIFTYNLCVTYGKDIASYPTILDVKNIEYHQKYSEITIIQDVQSGYKAQNPIQVRFIDEEMKEVYFIEFDKYPHVVDDIKEEFSQYSLQIESQQIGLLGDLKQSYSLKDYAFVFDVSFSFQPSDSSLIKIKSAQSLPQFLHNTQIMVQKQFEISVKINFRECQVGEVFQKNGNYTLCYTCEFGFYSIVNPYSSDDVSCQKCPIGSTNCSSSEIQIENGYWRSGDDSDIVIYCQNKPESCSNKNNTKNGCVEGFIGPLCEECDVKGELWGDKYAKTNDFVCTNCKQFNEISNILIFIFIFVFIISQLFYKVYKQVLATKKYILSIYLSKLGLISPSIQTSQTNSTSLIKILLNYFQFMMIVNSLNISIPIYFSGFSLSGGDTSQHTINRLDCHLFKYHSNIPNYIIRIIWVNLQPVVLFLFLEVLSQFTIQNTQVQAQKQTLYTNLIVIFSFFQPSQVKVLSQSISCRKIGDKQYILSDLNEICLSEDHLYYFKSIILPLGIFWVFFGPLYLLYRMNHHKTSLETIRIIFNYGYLYQEYNHRHYYWDILKMFIRSFTIITINLFNFNVLLKGLVINGLIQFYITILNKNKPYRVKRFNSLDQESCDLVNKTIFLLYVSYLCENEIINSVIALMIVSFNGLFILQMLFLIIIKPIPPTAKQRNVFEVFLYRIKQRYPYLFYWVKIGDTNRTKVYILWKRVQRKLKQKKLIASNIEKSLSKMMNENQMTISTDYDKPKKTQKKLKKSIFTLIDDSSPE